MVVEVDPFNQRFTKNYKMKLSRKSNIPVEKYKHSFSLMSTNDFEFFISPIISK
jgi:hypothetical protein